MRVLALAIAVTVVAGCGTMRRTRWYQDATAPVAAARPPSASGSASVGPRRATLFGTDLSRYRSIVFVVDVAAPLCGPVGASEGRTMQVQLASQRFPIDEIGRALAAAVDALPSETRVAVIVASGGSHLAYFAHAPGGHDTVAGRRRCGELLRELLCHGEGTGRLIYGLRRAFEQQPDVVVVLSSDLGSFDAPDRGDEEDEPVATDLPLVAADPIDELATWKRTVPVIAISLDPDGDATMKSLAVATGGHFVASGK